MNHRGPTLEVIIWCIWVAEYTVMSCLNECAYGDEWVPVLKLHPMTSEKSCSCCWILSLTLDKERVRFLWHHLIKPVHAAGRPLSFKGHPFLLQLRRCASVSCAQNNFCFSVEESRSCTINALVVTWPQHRKLRPSNLAEHQQSGAHWKWKSVNSAFSARTVIASFLCIWPVCAEGQALYCDIWCSSEDLDSFLFLAPTEHWMTRV